MHRFWHGSGCKIKYVCLIISPKIKELASVTILDQIDADFLMC